MNKKIIVLSVLLITGIVFSQEEISFTSHKEDSLKDIAITTVCYDYPDD